MNRRQLIIAAALLLLVSGVGGRPVAAANPTPAWKVIELGPLPGGTWTEADFINDRGVVVGVSDTGEHTGFEVVRWDRDGRPHQLQHTWDTVLEGRPTGLSDTGWVSATMRRWADPEPWYQAVRWGPAGEFTALPNLAGYRSSGAASIADDGSVVGTSYLDNEHSRAVRWESDGRALDLGTLSGGANSHVIGGNGGGEAFGYSDTATGGQHLVRWDRRGRVTDLGEGGAYAISDRGEVAGYVGTYLSWEARPARWNVNGRVTVGEVPAGHNAYASAINNRGTTSGVTNFGGSHALRWDRSGRLTTLTEPSDVDSSYVLAINDRDEVVGAVFRQGEPSRPHAAYWDRRGSWTDLGVLPGFADSGAGAINRHGDIIGGVSSADYLVHRAVLWTPVPTPDR